MSKLPLFDVISHNSYEISSVGDGIKKSSKVLDENGVALSKNDIVMLFHDLHKKYKCDLPSDYEMHRCRKALLYQLYLETKKECESGDFHEKIYVNIDYIHELVNDIKNRRSGIRTVYDPEDQS